VHINSHEDSLCFDRFFVLYYSSIALAAGAAFNVFFILSGCCISGSLTDHGIYHGSLVLARTPASAMSVLLCDLLIWILLTCSKEPKL
jgi:hypothetical protein